MRYINILLFMIMAIPLFSQNPIGIYERNNFDVRNTTYIQYGVSFKFSYIFAIRKKKIKPSFSTSLAGSFGVNHVLDNFRYRPGLNIGVNLYGNGNIGTERRRSNVGKKRTETFRIDYYITPEMTLGGATLKRDTISDTWGKHFNYTFDKLYNTFSESSIPNDFQYSISLKTNYIFNNKGMNQRVGNISIKTWMVYLNYMNDGGPVMNELGLGDSYDRYWTGALTIGLVLPWNEMKSIGIEHQNSRIEFCYDIHTGFSKDAFRVSTGLLFEETDYGDATQVLMNTGSLRLRYISDPGIGIEIGLYGGDIMWGQNCLHRALKESKHAFVNNIRSYFIGANYNHTLWNIYTK